MVPSPLPAVEHGVFFSHVPPRRHGHRKGPLRRWLEQGLIRPGQGLGVPMGHEGEGQVIGRVHPDGVGHHVAGEDRDPIRPAPPLGPLGLTRHQVPDGRDADQWVLGHVQEGVAQTHDQGTIEGRGMAAEAIRGHQFHPRVRLIGGQQIGQLRITPAAPWELGTGVPPGPGSRSPRGPVQGLDVGTIGQPAGHHRMVEQCVIALCRVSRALGVGGDPAHLRRGEALAAARSTLITRVATGQGQEGRPQGKPPEARGTNQREARG